MVFNRRAVCAFVVRFQSVSFLLPALLLLATTPMQGQRLEIPTRHVRAEVSDRRAALVGAMPADQQIHASVVLSLRNPDALKSLLGRLYDPASPDYRHFLSVGQFTEQFGPAQNEFNAVVAFAQAQGLTVGDLPANRLVVPIVGTVAQMNAAFNIRMNVYQHPTEDRTFFSTDREPSLNLSVPIAHIAGLDDFSLPHHMSIQGPAKGSLPLPRDQQAAAVLGSGPGGSYLGSDMRAAYYGGKTLDGNGQVVGILEYGGYSLSDVNLTFSNAGQSYQVPISNVLLDGAVAGSTTRGDAEQVLDIVQAIGMAPGLAQVRVYIGLGSDDPNILNSMASENLAKQISCSWGWRPADPSVDDVFFQEMAAQGQSFFTASGDSGAFDAAINPFFYPADDQYVTAVGGTHLTTNGAGGSWVSETVWNSGGGGSGGGISPDGISMPSWQAGLANSANGGSTTLRNVPDVAMEGDFDNYACSAGSCNGTWAGTSFAAPRWAGFMALVNQQAVESGNAPNGGLGFMNPAIYQLAQGAVSSSDFHDITVGNNDTANQPIWFNAVTGYDLATGWGSANGQQLIDDLAGPQVPGFWLASSLSMVGVNPGGAANTNIVITNAGGFSGSVNLAIASALPTGVTASFLPNPTTTGSSVLTLTATSAAPFATQIVAITGTSASLTATTNITVGVHAPGFSLAAAPTTVGINQGSSGASTIYIQSLYGFTGTVSLAVTGLPAGVTASFGPTSATGTSLLTLNVSSSALGGNSTLTVTGTSGSLTASTNLTLSVHAPSFALSTSSTLNMGQGASAAAYVYVTDQYGFTGSVNLAVSGLPNGVTASFSPNSTTGSSVLTFTTSSSATPGQSTVTITGTSGTLTATTSINLGVFAPAFSLSSSGSLSIGQGNSSSTYVYVTNLYGFNGLVNLAVSGLPTGVTATLSPNPTNGSATVTFATSSSAAVGQSVVTVTGTSGSISATTTITLGVFTPTFTLSNSGSVVVGQGNSIVTYIYVNNQYGFTGSVNLAVSGLPSGVTASVSPNPSTGQSLLTIVASSAAKVAHSLLTITGTSGSITATTTVDLGVFTPTFTLSSNDVNVGQASSATAYVFVNDQYGFTGSVNLAVSGLPTGVTASFSTNPTTGSSVLTFNAASSATPGQSVISITGTSGSVTATTNINLGVYAPSFTLSNLGGLSIGRGTSAIGNVYVNSQYGFTGAVNLAATGLPTGVTASFSPNPTTGSSTVTFTASSSATLGQSVVTITGTSGSITASTTMTLGVFTPTFTLGSGGSVSLGQGNSTATNININGQYGFKSPVSLSVSGLPTGVTALWTPNPTTTNSSLTLSASSSVAVGQYTLTISGVSGSVTATTSLTLTISSPSFTLASYSSVNLGQGATGTAYIYTTDLYGFTGSVSMSVTGLPSGVTAVFSPNPVTTANGSSVLTLTASSAAAAGQYVLTITGTSGTQTATTILSLAVFTPTFTLPSIGAINLGQGTSSSNYLYLNTQYGFSGTVALSLSGMPSGVTASFSPNPTSGSTQLVINASSTAPVGQYTVIMTGTSGTQTQTTSFVLGIYAPTFTLSSYSSVLIGQGNAGSAYVYVNPQYGFTGNVNLSVSGLPSGVTASFSPNPTTGSSQLTLTASSTATTGQYVATITGTSGSVTATTSLSVTVAVPSFTISGTSSITVGQGASGSAYLYVSSNSGFAGNVNFSIAGLPGGVTASFSPNPTTYSSTLTFNVGASVPLSTSIVTVTGTSGSQSATMTFPFTIAAPTFTMYAISSSVSLNQGGSASNYVYTNSANGFSGNVTLAASGLPTGVTATFSSNPTTYSSNVNFTASSTATPGTSTVTITGTSGSTTAFATFTVTVTASSFNLSAAPANVLIQPGGSQKSLLTVVPVNGFLGSVNLVASGLPNGVTASISPNPSSSTSTLTLTAATTATPISGSVTITGTSGSLVATAILPVTVIQLPGASATTLALTSAGNPVSTVASSTLVTATAIVTANSTPLTLGQVNFCDTTATTCDSLHIIGTAQITNTGTAVLQFIPGPGSHHYKAFFAGTRTNATSASVASSLTVTASLPSTTAIAQSGNAGNYTLTATVVGQGRLAPSGNVSFLDTSDGNFSLGSAVLGNGVATFSTSATQTAMVGVQPDAVASGDFNGDGIPDLAVVNSTSSTVSILLGKGDGTFLPPTNLGTGGSPDSIAAGDFNRDGRLDLVIASSIGGGVDVYLGNGDGTFTPSVFSPQTGSSPAGLAVGDYDSDGLLDVAVANSGSGTVTVLLGRGDGTFTATSSSPVVGSNPRAIVQGDFNGDGVADLAVANVTGFSVSILLGVGDGTFGAATTAAVTYPYSLAVGDLNGDGKLDLAVGSEYYSTAVLLGNGDGTFSVTNLFSSSSSQGIAIADMNGDGKPDLITTNSSYGTSIALLPGNGDGTFATAVPITVGSTPVALAIGDWNGDGVPDIAVANGGDGTATILTTQLAQKVTASQSGISPLGSGQHSVDASYSGDTVYTASISGPTTLTATSGAPSVTLGLSAPSVSFAQPLSVTVSVSAGSANPAPTGSLQLTSGSYTSGTVSLNAGAVAITVPAGTLSVGTDALSASYVPDSASSSRYTAAVGAGSVIVTQATPIITWATPTPVFYGTALSSVQLNATASVPGTFVYSPAAGFVLSVGNNTLTTTFTPTDTVNYTTATASVALTINPLYSIWLANGNGSVSGLMQTGAQITASGLPSGGQAIAVDHSGFVWSLNQGSNSIAEFSKTGSVVSSGYTGGGLSNPTSLAIDGGGILWIANGNNTISAFTVSGVPASPTAYSTSIPNPTSINVDGSGNLWITNAGDNSVTEMIGIASPVVTPTASAVKNATLANKP